MPGVYSRRIFDREGIDNLKVNVQHMIERISLILFESHRIIGTFISSIK